MRTPKRGNAQPSWVKSSFDDKDGGKKASSLNKSLSANKNKTVSSPRYGKIQTNKSPSNAKKDKKTPSTTRWNSTSNVTNRSPKFITIPDIECEQISPKRNKKSSGNSSELIIIDERSPGSRTPGTARKYSRDKTPEIRDKTPKIRDKGPRISVTNSRSSSIRRADDDDVLICKPLPSLVRNTTSAGNKNSSSFDEVNEVGLVPCPMCGDSFLPNFIENHANSCLDSFNNLG